MGFLKKVWKINTLVNVEGEYNKLDFLKKIIILYLI